MKLSIYKYAASVQDSIELRLPKGASILTVQMQHNEPCIWALVDPSAPEEVRLIHVRGTGHPANGLGRYIGTIQMRGGALVFHYFESKED